MALGTFTSVIGLFILLLLLEKGSAQKTSFKCKDNWCYNRNWTYQENRLLRYSYEQKNKTVTIHYNQTLLECVQRSFRPNSHQCDWVPVNVLRNITFVKKLPHTRNETPVVQKFNSSLSVIATDNYQDVLGHNESVTPYEPLQDKIWQIWIPKGCRMLLYFDDFDLESTPNCTKDFFAIQDKKHGTVTKYCGGISNLPNVTNSSQIQITRRRAQLTFHSDSTVTKKGLRATFCFQNKKSLTSPPCSCNINTSKATRRRRQSNNKPMSRRERRQAMAMQDYKIGKSLRAMMRDGLPAVDMYRHSLDREERYIAEKYYEAVTEFEEEEEDL